MCTGLSSTDQNAAVRARHRVRATTVRGQRRDRHSEPGRDTDDETNEGTVYIRMYYVMHNIYICAVYVLFIVKYTVLVFSLLISLCSHMLCTCILYTLYPHTYTVLMNIVQCTMLFYHK